jgi:hypothetical protein
VSVSKRAPKWFTVAGEAVRDFAPNGAQQVVVEVLVSPGTPPGSYSFRLDAVSEVDGPQRHRPRSRPRANTQSAAGTVVTIRVGRFVSRPPPFRAPPPPPHRSERTKVEVLSYGYNRGSECVTYDVEGTRA